jgi:competence protein ComEA
MKARSRGAVSALLSVTLLFLALAPALAAPAAGAAEGSSEKININTAGIDQLMSLPGIGKAYAERIVEYRSKNGPFKRVEDLLNVRGVGEKTFQRIKDRLTLGKG